MTRKILVTGILLSLFLACSKKQDEDAIDMAKGCLIRSETLNDKPFRTYEYSEENRCIGYFRYLQVPRFRNDTALTTIPTVG